MPEPIAPWRMSGIFHGMNSLMSPMRTKQTPPSTAIVQWLWPRHAISMRKYTQPPHKARTACFRIAFNFSFIADYSPSACVSFPMRLWISSWADARIAFISASRSSGRVLP